MKREMTIEYLNCRADLNFEVDFGVNGAIGAIVGLIFRVGKKPGFFVINRKNSVFWFKPGFFGFYGFFSVCIFL